MQFLVEQMPALDLHVLQKLVQSCARKNMVVFELGSFTGYSAVGMLKTIHDNNGSLYCVDWFKGNVGVDWLEKTCEDTDILGTFRRNLEESGYEGNTSILVGNTNAIGAIVANNSADMVFIDADHRYSGIKKDIETWYPKVRPGGILCGHDFERPLNQVDLKRALEFCETDFVDNLHYGVIRAVSERFPEVEHEGSIWWVRKLNWLSKSSRATSSFSRRVVRKLARMVRPK
jgi:hypothetical protein